MDNLKLQRKTLEVKFTKSSFSEDDQYYHFSGYGATFNNVDRGNEVIKSGAFVNSLKEIFPKFCYQHDMRDPIGIFTEIKEDHYGLFVRGKMRKGFEKTKWIAGLIEDGAIDSMSIGFGINKGGYEYDSKTGITYLTDLKLYEVSFVTLPMNAEARIDSFKSDFAADEIKSIRDVETVLKEAGFSVKSAKTLISKIKELNSCDESNEQCDVAQKNDLNVILAEIKQLTQLYKS